jgi:hypothetical protein
MAMSASQLLAIGVTKRECIIVARRLRKVQRTSSCIASAVGVEKSPEIFNLGRVNFVIRLKTVCLTNLEDNIVEEKNLVKPRTGILQVLDRPQ